MLRLNSTDQLPVDFVSTVVTIGKFDGVHIGHQALLAEALEISEEHSMAAVALTFDRSPIELLHPEDAHPAITGPSQKLDLLEAAGMDAAITLEFNEELAALPAEDFVTEILVNDLNAKVIVVGEDFRFGQGGVGDVAALKLLGLENGFTVRVVSSVLVDGTRVSSTLIRNALNQGDVELAATYLGRLHATRGMVEHGLKIGRTLGFPTANVSRQAEGYLPLDGVYAGWLHSEGIRYPAALSIGINDTIQAVPRLLEAYVLDRNDLDLYDKVVNVEYVAFIRHSAKFSGMDELIAAIHTDCDRIRTLLALR